MSEQKIISAASGLRQELGLNVMDAVPDIVTVVEDLGYIFHEEDFGNDFSGYCHLLDSNRAIIGFNINHYYNEGYRRFTVSHELGHLSIPEHREYLTRKKYSPPSFSSTKKIEQEADMFAAHFLAPRSGVREAAKKFDFTMTGVENIASLYSLSFTAASLRFVECTDLRCALIAINSEGIILWDKRSRSFHEAYYPQQIRGQSISKYTSMSDLINSRTREEAEVDLGEWYPSLCDASVMCLESPVDVNYNNQYLALLTILD